MTTQFPAKRVADLSDAPDLRWMIELCILQLMDRVLVIDRISRQIDQVARVVAGRGRRAQNAKLIRASREDMTKLQ